MSAAFATKGDRDLVRASAKRAGWKASKLGGVASKLGDVGVARAWEVELSVESLWVESVCCNTASKKPVQCFIRYRFFDLGELAATEGCPYQTEREGDS